MEGALERCEGLSCRQVLVAGGSRGRVVLVHVVASRQHEFLREVVVSPSPSRRRAANCERPLTPCLSAGLQPLTTAKPGAARLPLALLQVVPHFLIEAKGD